jgi:hypothetical protein
MDPNDGLKSITLLVEGFEEESNAKKAQASRICQNGGELL